ncbi:flavoprotein, partial [Streptomyces anulatus]
GIYLVGMKSYGRAPTFLAMTGYEQVRSIAAAIAGDLDAADRVELPLPETGVCGGAGLYDTPDAAQGDGSGCCAPALQLVQLSAPAAEAAGATAAEEAPPGGCCGS